MSSSNPTKGSRQISGVEKGWAAEHLDFDVLAGILQVKEGQANEVLQARGDYIRHHKNEGMFIMECKGGAIHVYTPFATQTSGWARRIVQACSTPTSPHYANQFTVPCHNWHPYFVDRVADFWSTGELAIKDSMALEFAITPPTNPQDADMSDTSPMLATIYMLQYAVRLDDAALLQAALDQLRHRIATQTLDKHDFITGLQIFSSWQEQRKDVALIRRVLLSALVKTEDIFTKDDLSRDFERDFQREFSSMYVDYCRGRRYYWDVFGKKYTRKKYCYEQGSKIEEEEDKGESNEVK